MNSKNIRLIVSIITIIFGAYLIWTGVDSNLTPSVIPDNPPLDKISPQPLVSKTPEATSSAVLSEENQKLKVTRVIDGDTIEIVFENNEKKTVRLIGIDTPETVDPRRGVQCFGREASSETKSLLEGKEVYLTKDVSEIDRFGRILRYIYLPIENGQLLFVNDYLIREGYARILTYPPDVKFNERFLEAEREAREFKKGLWDRC